VLVEAGALAIGLNGVFGGQERTPSGKLVLRKELIELGVRGRKIYLAFDADSSSNPVVRQAEIRLWFLLRAAGAEVFRLTSWDESEGKGIDDYLVNATKEDPGQSRESIVQMLLQDAQPFISSMNKFNTVDLDAVVSEMEKVAFTRPQRDQLCKELSEPLGVKVDVLRLFGAEIESQSRKIIFQTFDPWPEPVDINTLIQDLVELYRKHVVLDDSNLLTVVLWGLLTFFADSDKIDTMPILTITSPEKRCGKTRLQSVLEWIVYRPLSASNISGAAVYRTVEIYGPTLLLDEVDTFIKDDEQLLGIFNSGHTRQKAFVIRTNPITMEPERFSVWCPKSFALIGRLPGTLLDRSIEIRLDRKKRVDKVSPLRDTPLEKRLEFQRKILRWVADYGNQLEPLDPSTIQQLNDRAADNWVPLLQVAELAGQVWFDNAKKAMIALNPQESDPETEAHNENLATAVLNRLRRIFYNFVQVPVRDLAEAKARAAGKSEEEIEAAGKDATQNVSPTDDLFIPTSDLLVKLNADKEAPWADWHKGTVEGLSAEKLSRILRPYKVKSVRLRRAQPMGYKFGILRPVFERYLEIASDLEPD
jgi:putative DNA primase/helicase